MPLRAAANPRPTADGRQASILLLLVAHVAPGGHPSHADPKRFALIGPYESDPAKRNDLPWRNVYNPNGPTYALTTESVFDRAGMTPPDQRVCVKTYRDVLTAYRLHPETKSLGPDGRPCARSTIGLLSRRPVRVVSVTHVGKESNLLEEVAAGLISAEEEVRLEYHDRRADAFARLVLPVLSEQPAAEIARDTGLDLSTVKRVRSGRVQPSTRSRALLTRHAGVQARQRLADLGVRQTPGLRDDLTACAHYLEQRSRSITRKA